MVRSCGWQKLVLILLVATCSFAEVCTARPVYSRFRSLLAIDPPETVLWSNTLYLHRPVERDFYEEIFASGDRRVVEMYDQYWITQPGVVGALASVTSYDQSSRASVFAPHWQVQERIYRDQIAYSTFRIRLDESLQNYLTHPDRAPELNRVRRAIESVRDTSVALSSDGSIRTEMRIGYDLASDASHAEVVVNEISAGFYHPHTGDIGTDHPVAAARLATSVRFDRSTKSASVSYPMTGDYVIGVYSQPLATGLFGSFSTTQVLKPGPANFTTYNFTVGIEL